MLTNKQIHKLIELTKLEVVAKFDGYKVVRDAGLGYSKDPEIGAIQAALSIMLEMNAKTGRG